MMLRSYKVTAYSLLAAVLLCAGVWLAAPHYLHAQQAGLSISPALIEETLDPGFEKKYSVEIKNINSDSDEVTYYLSTRNIADVKAGGIPVFAKDEEETGMELADWIELETKEITLAGGQNTTVNFTMRVPENAAPGSHFGGVFISVDPPEIERSGAAVGYQVANIVSIRVSGDVIEEASIRQFSTDKFLYGTKNVDFSVRIENRGNVLVRPYGPLEITNMLGQKIDSIIFNENQNSVFPGRSRDYSISWEGEGTGFGRYEAVISPVYGDEGAKKTISSTVTFWILPMSIIGPALGVLALLLLITFVSVRIYINRTLAQYTSGRTRIVRRRKRGAPSGVMLLMVTMLTVTALFLIVLLALFA